MSSFFSLLPADGWQRLQCDALWQSTFIAGLGWLVARCLVRQSAARAWVLLMTLIACAVVPLASMATRANGWTVLPADRDLSPLQSAAVTVTPEEVEQFVQQLSSQPTEPDPSAPLVVDSTAKRPTNEPQAKTDRPSTVKISDRTAAVAAFLPVAAGQAVVRFTGAIVLQILATIWLAFSALLAARLILAIAATRRTLQNAVPCNDATLLAAAAEAARRIGVPCPGVFYSRHVETPTIYALGHPRLLVPQTSGSDGLDCVAIDWVAAFSHELAHIARGDGWSRLAVECVRFMLPLQPLIWLLRRSFHTVCEEACDDWAVATGTNPVDLADTLTAWINRPRRASSLVAIGMSSTKSRTLRLLSLRKQPIAKLGNKWRFIGLPIAFGLIAALSMAQSHANRDDKKESLPATQRTDDGNSADKLELKHHDGKADGKKSLGGSGEMIRFTLPAAQKISGIRIHGSRYGLAKPPDEDFLIYLLGPDSSEVLSTQKAPYSLFERGEQEWVAVRFPKPIEVPKDFWLALDFRAEQTKGVYVSYDTSTGGKFSKIGLPGAKSREVDFGGDWMIELLPENPADAKSKSAFAPSAPVGERSERNSVSGNGVIATPATVNLTTLKLRDGSVALEIPIDSSQIVALDRDIPRAQVNNREIIELIPVSPNQIVVYSKRPGRTEVILWDRDGKSYTVECVVTNADEKTVGFERAAPRPIQASLLDSDEPNTWRWKLFIPKGHRYAWKVASDQIPRDGPPAERRGGYVTTISNEPYWNRDNEVMVTAKLRRIDSAKWRLTVESKINSGTGKPIDQMSGAALEIPAAKLTWMTEVSSTDGQLLGSHGDVDVDPNGPIILLQRRPCERQPDGSSLPAKGPAPGFMIWLERLNAKTGEPEGNPTKPKDADNKSALLPTEANLAPLPPYEIEPPDILLIGVSRLAPKEPFAIQPFDILKVDADPNSTTLDDPLYGPRLVEPGGMLNLGARYGKVKVSGLSLEEAEAKVIEKLKKIFKDPKVSVTLDESGGTQQISGEHLVGPDGTINLGTYGQVYVSQLTIPEAKDAIEKKLSDVFKKPEVSVDIYAYNSKVYYVITKRHGFGDNIMRFPVTGNETVLDAISQVQGLTRLSDAKVWIERPKSRYSSVEKKFDVKWDEITMGGGIGTNYQVLPGDRIYIDSPQVTGKDAKKSQTPSGALPGTTNF